MNCLNPSQPCQIHESEEQWHIVAGPWRIHAGWGIAAVVLILIVTLIPGLS